MDIKIIDLKQRHVEIFAREMPKNAGELPASVYRGEVVRAACKAGWFVGPVFKAEEVGEMTPADVSELFSAAMKVYAAAMDVSPS